MITRILAAIGLVLAVVFSTGCAVVDVKTTTTRKAVDGTEVTTTTEEKRLGVMPSSHIAPRVYVPTPNYGRDYYYGGRPSYDPTPPVPHVIFGDMLGGSQRAANVNGVWRTCDTRSTAPNYCHQLMDAYKWPMLTPSRRR